MASIYKGRMLNVAQNEYLENALRAVPLTDAQIALVTRVLQKNTAFLSPLAKDSGYWNFREKIDEASWLLGLDRGAYIVAALKQPSLFSRSPETINRNIEEVAALLGVGKAAYIGAALKQPPLFYRAPEAIYRNVQWVRAVAEKGAIKSDDLIQDMLRFPSSFCYAPQNTHLRYIDACDTGKSRTLSGFFTASNKKEVEQAITEHYRDAFNRTGKGMRTMQVLAEAGVLSRLPDWVDAPENLLRKRMRAPNAP